MSPDHPRISRRWTLRNLTLAVLALGIAWRLLRYAVTFPLWGDEAFLAATLMNRGLREMWPPWDYGQIAPVGFMWMEWAVAQLFGFREWSLRLVPLIIGLLAIAAYAHFLRRTTRRTTGRIALAIFTASYFVARYAVELKPYGMDLLAATILLSLTCATLRRPSSKNWASLIIASAAAVWFSFPAAFLSAGIGAALLRRAIVLRTRNIRRGLSVYVLVAGGSALTMLFLSARPQATASAWLTDLPMWQPAFPPISQPWKLPVWLLTVHAGELLAYPTGGRNGASALPLLLAALGAVAMWRRRRELLCLLLSPLPFMFVAAALRRYPYGGSIRTSLFMAPSFCLLIATGFAALLSARSQRTFRVGCAAAITLMGAFVLGGMLRDAWRPYHQVADQRNRRSIEAIRERTQHGDEWIVFNSLTDVAYAPNLYAWGGSGARFRYYLSLLAPVPIRWSPRPESLHRGSITWLFVYRDNKAEFPEAALRAYLERLTQQLGAGDRRVFELGGSEAIEVYRFSTGRT